MRWWYDTGKKENMFILPTGESTMEVHTEVMQRVLLPDAR